LGNEYTSVDFEVNPNGSINVNTTADSLSTSGEINNQQNHTEYHDSPGQIQILLNSVFFSILVLFID
jgi:hypothetical protein